MDTISRKNECPQDQSCTQTHDHEFLGSTMLAAEEDHTDIHNHRFAGVTSEVIPEGNSHVHAILVNTDFFDHHHEIGVTTGTPIDVGGGKHVHLATGTTTMDDGHVHNFIFTTLINCPLVVGPC